MNPRALVWHVSGNIPINMWFKYHANQNLIDQLYDKVIDIADKTNDEKYELGWFDKGCWYKPKPNFNEIYENIQQQLSA